MNDDKDGAENKGDTINNKKQDPADAPKHGRKSSAGWGMFAAGILWGIVFAFIFGVVYLRSALITEMESPSSFSDTLAKLRIAAKNTEGWTVTPLSCSLPQPKDGSKVAVLKLCHGRYAAKLMDDQHSRRVSAMIPCSLAVYEKNGKTYVAKMNVKLIGTLLGGTAARVFSLDVSPDQSKMLEQALGSNAGKAAPKGKSRHERR